MIVVDASVSVKWFLKENYSTQAITLLEWQKKPVAPWLSLYEVAGAFVRAGRRGEIDEEAVNFASKQWLHSIRTNVMRLDHDQRDILHGTDIATTLNHPLADCVYLALANRLDVPLITADENFISKAEADFSNIVFLGDAAQSAISR